MKISIEEIEKVIKSTLKDAMVLNTNSVYEKIDGSEDLKLIIFFNKVFNENSALLYTKLIFVVNHEKQDLVNNSFLYLYDLNCVYNNIDFEDIEDFKKKLRSIFKNEKFGKNILILSEFIKSPALSINDWLKENNVNELSVLGIKYDPKISIMPCKSLFFAFEISLSNQQKMELTITKEREGKYIYNFKIDDQSITLEKNNLNTLIEVIGDVLKNNFIK